MTKKVEYKCNFCHNANFHQKQIYGIYWYGKDDISLVNKKDSGNHLCDVCLSSIHRVWDNVIRGDVDESLVDKLKE